jgi:AcrR family transcriptional regulator
MKASYAERRKQALREEIMAAAFACFAERGYQNTGIADIADRVGIGNSTFYRQFRSKQEILEQVIDNTIVQLYANLGADNAPEAVASMPEYRAQVERISHVIGDLVRDDRMVRLLLIQSMTLGPELEQRIHAMLESFVSHTARYLAHGREGGYLRADLDADGTARAVVSLIVGSTYLGLNPGLDRETRRKTSRAVLELIFGGVAQPEVTS